MEVVFVCLCAWVEDAWNVGAVVALYQHQATGVFRFFSGVSRAVKFEQVVHCPVHALDDDSLHQFDLVIYLGGLTGRKECDASTPDEVEDENVQDVLRLAARMNANQLLVFASTSAIAKGSGAKRHAFVETDDPDPDAMDAYTHSLFRREKSMKAVASHKNYNGPKVVALRFKFQPFLDLTTPKVAVVGAAGYVGSAALQRNHQSLPRRT